MIRLKRYLAGLIIGFGVLNGAVDESLAAQVPAPDRFGSFADFLVSKETAFYRNGVGTHLRDALEFVGEFGAITFVGSSQSDRDPGISGSTGRSGEVRTVDLAPASFVGNGDRGDIGGEVHITNAMYAMTDNGRYALHLKSGDLVLETSGERAPARTILGATFRVPAPDVLFLFGSGALALVAFPRRPHQTT